MSKPDVQPQVVTTLKEALWLLSPHVKTDDCQLSERECQISILHFAPDGKTYLGCDHHAVSKEIVAELILKRYVESLDWTNPIRRITLEGRLQHTVISIEEMRAAA